MTQVKFIRTTHENGRWRSFPTQAWQFWREYGAVVGEVVRAETPMSFAEIVIASREHALEYPESGLYLALNDAYIAWCLIRLLEYGMSTVVAEGVDAADAVF